MVCATDPLTLKNLSKGRANLPSWLPPDTLRCHQTWQAGKFIELNAGFSSKPCLIIGGCPQEKRAEPFLFIHDKKKTSNLHEQTEYPHKDSLVTEAALNISDIFKLLDMYLGAQQMQSVHYLKSRKWSCKRKHTYLQ